MLYRYLNLKHRPLASDRAPVADTGLGVSGPRETQ